MVTLQMMHLFSPCALTLSFLSLLYLQTLGQRVISAGDLDPEYQQYDFSAGARLRLLAHQSVVLRNENHHLLVIHGGFGKFETEVDGELVHVQDLNRFTVAFDLSAEFKTTDLNPLWQYPEPDNDFAKMQITNHGGIFVSADQNIIWYQGGQYYNAEGWNRSLYHVDKGEIPEWQMWEMNTLDHRAGWRDATAQIDVQGGVNRTFAGAAISAPETGMSYWIGGLLTSKTSTGAPNNVVESSPRMLIFNETARSISHAPYDALGRGNGYWHGELLHLPIGGHGGYLISLMSLSRPAYTPWPDPDGDNGSGEDSDASIVSFKFIPLYDLEAQEWYLQETSYFEDEIPESRTRFCAALFHDEADNTWDVWVHGGQLPNKNDSAVPDIYVLSLPAFVWKKITPPASALNEIRSHTCHALGDQFVIVGGYPPGQVVPKNASIEDEYVKVLKIGDTSLGWVDTYETGTAYRTPEGIRRTVPSREPYYGWANISLKEAFEGDRRPPGGVGAIAGGVVGGVLVLVGIVGLIWRWRRRRGKPEMGEPRATDIPRSPNCDQPEVAQHGSLPVVEARAPQESSGRYSGARSELEGSIPRHSSYGSPGRGL